jgi:hypothetical protein
MSPERLETSIQNLYRTDLAGLQRMVRARQVNQMFSSLERKES